MTPSLPPIRNILIISPYYTGHGGETERVIEKLIKEIAFTARCQFTWSASDLAPLPSLNGHTLLPMTTHNLLERSIGLAWPLWSIRSLRQLVEAIAETECVWLHNTLSFGNLFAYIIARRHKKPILITQHHDFTAQQNPLLRRILSFLDRRITQPILCAVDQVVFTSDRVGEDYNRRIGFEHPVKIITNSVELRTFNPPMMEKRQYLRQSFALRADQPVLLYVGDLMEQKGLAVIHNLAQLLPRWRFWLAGTSRRGLGNVDPIAWQLPNVHVFPDRQGSDLAELYQAADLLILPGQNDTFPLAAQEALACALPVLCSPAIAAGSQLASSHLHQAEIWPDDPARTATYWAQRLQNFPWGLPLAAPHVALSEFAQIAWSWPAVADAYSDIFNTIVPAEPHKEAA